MGLTVGSRELADLRVRGVSLLPTVGGYEIAIGLDLTVNADNDASAAPRRAAIIGARISVSGGEGQTHRLGFARPEEPFAITSKPFTSRVTHSHRFHLHPSQLSALETLRGTEDLTFDLLVIGTGVDGQHEHQVQDNSQVSVPRSEWIDMLRDAGARDIMLLEVPLPLASPSDDSDEVRIALLKAEGQFRTGDYTGCIASCRTVIQEAGQRGHGQRQWAPKALDRLAGDRKAMTKSDRESALWAILRHYAHLAHHGTGEGGVPDFTRADAQFVFRLTVAAVVHAQAALSRQPPLPED